MTYAVRYLCKVCLVNLFFLDGNSISIVQCSSLKYSVVQYSAVECSAVQCGEAILHLYATAAREEMIASLLKAERKSGPPCFKQRGYPCLPANN